ncbi:MAG: pyruvate:ferredoxin (flavodoxin) oxidoreductase, partial [Anaerolineales bacterium]|nr:pyruvate:ferredoxin (flavodoxin) oxidoreductase [Anaerolineales bacterium]
MSESNREMLTLDGNEAVARVAYKLSEVVAIYPITPSTPMGEWADQWMSEVKANLWGVVPSVVEMQSEGGAAGAVHGALQAGSLTTTFTASQGLMLMLPNMHKIAGELTSAVFHIAARSLAAQGLSIFGDHSDVMAARNTGWVMLASNSVQEAQDFAALAHMTTLKARLPFLHFFDGYRVSHEVNKIETLTDADLRALIDEELIHALRLRSLNPERPVMRGTAQNPDVYFQGRETVNAYYTAVPGLVQAAMDKFAALTGRRYQPYEYEGAPDAERVIVVMGSGAETAVQTAKYLIARGEKVGVLKVRLYRPFAAELFTQALPASVHTLAVLDRCKEPGSGGEPLYLDVVAALHEAWEGHMPTVIGGRYGLSSKEFTPAMAKAVFDELDKVWADGRAHRRHFTVGIKDDVTHLSLDYDPAFNIESADTVRAMFFGLGSDGTVGANKNSIKIIGEDTPNHAQGYFVYDSKKSGSITVSHLRFGPRPIQAPYLVEAANFVACHQFSFLERFDVLKAAVPGAVFLLNSPSGPDEVWNTLPRSTQQQIIAKHLHFYVVDALKIAREAGMGGRINTVMQVCFFAISGVLPKDEAIDAIKNSIRKTYGKRGEAVVQKNFAAVDATLANLHEVAVPAEAASLFDRRPTVPANAPDFIKLVTAPMMAGLGDDLPVSALPADGTYPTGTTKWEKRNIATEIPVWDASICIQCGKCAYVCPHAVIREKVFEPVLLEHAPAGFKRAPARFKEFKDMAYVLQVAPEDCTGCGICVEACPVKNKSEIKLKAINMQPQAPLRDAERANWEFFQTLPEVDRTAIPVNSVKYSQLLTPLFEFSGACAGCGETPYLKLISQLFGDRALIANATGCSSIYGGNLPTTPWAQTKDGRGPAWSNSLFEDNAEFGYGMRLAVDHQVVIAAQMLTEMRDTLGAELVDGLLHAEQKDEAGLQAQRGRVAQLKRRLAKLNGQSAGAAARLLDLADVLVRRSIWIIGGDGWAYDIGYGGLDHVLAAGRKVNVLVMDTEVYSNTGGQMSKATPRAAVAKFAAGGKPMPKKDLALLAVSYGHIYVA